MLIVQKIALVLTIIGGINWALVGLLDFNLVTFFFQEGSIITRIIYVIIGICALFNIGLFFVRGGYVNIE
ncbi:MAG: DUF378 domain-containing protein [Anaeroplasmataceae bacterium]